MSRYSTLSPQTRLAPSLRIFPPPDEKDFLIQSLQSKLQILETKYSRFIEKCSEILKSEELKSEARDYFSECSSSVRFSPDQVPSLSLEEQENLFKVLKDLSEGDQLRQYMNQISIITEKAQNSLLQSLESSNLNLENLKTSMQVLKSNIWEVLIQKQELIKNSAQNSLKKFREFDKMLEDSLKSMKIERKLKEYKTKFLKTQDENSCLLQKIKEQNDCLTKIKEEYQVLKKKLLSTSPKMMSPSNVLRFSETLPRSQNSSPHQNELKRLKETNLNLHSRVKLLSYQNSILQQVKRSESGSDPKEIYEYEKKEIQDQLKALQNKLTGFEKIAKNLIDSSIRAELQSIGHGQKQGLLKKTKEDTPDESLAHTPLSLLEYDQVQKNLEAVEKEKNFLAETLKKEQLRNKEFSAQVNEKERKILKLNEELLNLQRKFQESFEELRKSLDEKDELEILVRDLKEIQKELDEQKSEMEARIKSLEEELRVLGHRNRSTEEEKNKVMNLLAKHSENEKRLEDNLKKWGEDYSKMQEVISNTKNFEKNQEINQITLNFSRKIEELETKHKETQENEQKLLKQSAILQETLERYSRENFELLEKLKNNEAQKFSLATEELENLTQLLEKSQKEYKKAKVELENFKKASEKRISEKDKIISSFELKNHENFQLTCELSQFEKKVERLESQICELSAENELLTEKINNLNEINSSKEKIIEDYEQENKKTSEKIRVLTENLQEFQRIMKENTQKLMNSEENNSKLQVAFEKLQEKLRSQSEKLKIDEEKIKLLEKTILSQNQLVNSMKSKLSETDESQMKLVSELEEKDFKISSLQTEVKSLKVEIVSHELSKSELEKDVLILNQKIKSKEETLEKKETLIVSFEKSLSDLKSLNENLTFKSNDQELRKKLAEIQNELNFKAAELDKREKHSRALENSLESTEEARRKLQIDFNQSKAIIETLKNKLNTNENQLLELKLKLSESKENEVNLVNKFRSLQTQAENSKDNLSEVLSKLSEKDVIIEELENQLKSTIEAHDLELKKYEEETLELKKAIKALNQALDTSKKSDSEQIIDLQSQCKQLQNQLKSNESLSSVKLEKLNVLNSELKKLHEENHSELLKARQRSEFTSKSIFSKFNTLKLNHSDLKKSVKSKLTDFEKSSEISQIFVAVFSKLTLVKAAHQKDLKDLKDQNDSLQIQIKNLGDRNQELCNKLKFKQDELEHLLIDSAGLKGKLVSFEAESFRLKQVELKNLEINDELARLRATHASLKSNNSELVSELERFKRLNFETSSQNERLSNKINQLQSDNQQLKTDLEVYSVKLIEKTKQIEFLSDKQESSKSEQVDLKEFEKQIKIKKQELHQLHQETQNLQKRIDEKNKIIEELSKTCNLLKVENEKSNKEQKNLNRELLKCKENLEDKELTVKKLNDTVIDLEKLLQSSQRNEEELKIILSKQDSPNLRTFQSNEAPGLPPRPERLIQNKHSVSALAPPISFSPGYSKGSSFNLNLEPSQKASQDSEDMNITPCKVLKVVKVRDKKWVLCLDDEGDYIWKNETGLHISGADNLFDPDEDLDDIKSALGEYFKGNIVEAINSLKEKVENLEFSVHLNPEDKMEVASHSFRGEIFDAGLDFSKIELKLQEHQDIETVTAELNKKFSEVSEKNKKLEKKKRKISLFKEQMTVLKEQIRKESEEKKEFEVKLKSNQAVNLDYLKQVFTNLISKLKADKNIEDLVTVLFKVLDFTPEEVSKVQNTRKGGKMLKK